ncbi:hypothetical protein Zm00014a_011042 [Zea mays]|uniref:Polycomb protein VEFS-Box domain-containing protein n=1 Tax=Zea mays TaxID=4577 RepID=A0A3L6E511_MAIZE|nr:hypothetical protein Zm00014a_011042 [Zea mays]
MGGMEASCVFGANLLRSISGTGMLGIGPNMWCSERTSMHGVLADGHIPWACEAFSQLHGRQLIQNPALLWGWRFFMIKLWNHNILDARTMNTCNTVLQILQEESTGLK